MAYPLSGLPVTNSGLQAAEVTPSDTTDLGATRALYVGGTGDVAVTMIGDSAAVTFQDVPAGTWLWLSVKHVMATGTGATNIVAIY